MLKIEQFVYSVFHARVEPLCIKLKIGFTDLIALILMNTVAINRSGKINTVTISQSASEVSDEL